MAATAQRAWAAAQLVDDPSARVARWRLPHSAGLELPLLAVARGAASG